MEAMGNAQPASSRAEQLRQQDESETRATLIRQGISGFQLKHSSELMEEDSSELMEEDVAAQPRVPPCDSWESDLAADGPAAVPSQTLQQQLGESGGQVKEDLAEIRSRVDAMETAGERADAMVTELSRPMQEAEKEALAEDLSTVRSKTEVEIHADNASARTGAEQYLSLIHI